MYPLLDICRDFALLTSGPVPEAYPVPCEELEDLLEQSRLLNRLVEFLGTKAVEPSFHRGHSSEYPTPDPWVMGYSIEVEHDGCYEFRRLAEGPDKWDVLRTGLDAWDKEVARWAAAERDR